MERDNAIMGRAETGNPTTARPMLKRSYSLRTFSQICIAAVLLVAVGILGIFWLVSEYRHHIATLNQVRADYIATRKAETKTLVDLLVESAELRRSSVEEQLKKSVEEAVRNGWALATAVYNQSKGRLPDQEIQQLIISVLTAQRFLNGRGYYWIHDTNSTLISHPFRSRSIGKDDRELTDSAGQKIIQSFIKTATTYPEGGFVTYYWNKPEVDESLHLEKGRKKIAYLKFFTPYNWVIGVGDYVADAEEEAKQAAIKRIAAVQYGTKGYVFVHTKEGVCLNHINKEVIGTNRWELVDADGKKIVQELDKTGRQPGGGFLEYMASVDPGTGAPARKVSFAKSVRGWDWVIGSGVYLDDIDLIISKYHSSLLEGLRNKIITTVCILIAILGCGFFIGHRLFQGLFAELSLFSMKPTQGKTEPIDTRQFRIKELQAIAHQANAILLEKEMAQTELSKAKRMQMVGLMAGGVAHDLNNLLSGIINYPELILLNLPQDSNLRDPLLRIQDSGHRAAEIVADLLTVARGIASAREIIDLNQAISDYLKTPQHEMLLTQHPGVACQSRLHPDPLFISCSPVHVAKCLGNLVTNAVESFKDNGSIFLSTRTVQADESMPQLEPGRYAVLEISDNGKGINSDDLPHIFEPFYTKKTMGRGGTGLGLTVVWNTMIDHQGAVTVASDGNGSRFHLYFPLSAEPAGQSSDMVDSKDLQGRGTILVVDDEEIQRDIASTILTILGYSVETVASGEEAIAFLHNRSADLVILDMIMSPGMNGRQTYEIMTRIRPGQKAIIVSGFSESEDVREACRLGVGGFLKKPYNLQQLGRAVKKELERS